MVASKRVSIIVGKLIGLELKEKLFLTSREIDSLIVAMQNV